MLLSVIVPVYNGGQTLHRAVQSVLDSTVWPDAELLIVDDGSTDRSFAVAERLARENPLVTARRITHAGVSAARNEGLRMAAGDFIAFLDADDRVGPEFHRRACQSMRGHDCVITGLTVVRPDGHEQVRRHRDASLSLSEFCVCFPPSPRRSHQLVVCPRSSAVS